MGQIIRLLNRIITLNMIWISFFFLLAKLSKNVHFGKSLKMSQYCERSKLKKKWEVGWIFCKSQLLNCWTLVKKRRENIPVVTLTNSSVNTIVFTRPEQDLSYHFLFLDIQKITKNVALNIRAKIGQNVQLFFWRKISYISNHSISSYKVQFGFGFGSSSMTKNQVQFEKIQKFEFDLSLVLLHKNI